MQRRRIFIMLGMISILFAYLSWSLLQGLTGYHYIQGAALVFLIGLFIMIVQIPLRLWKDRDRKTKNFSDRLIPWLSYLSMGTLSFIFFFVLIRDLFWSLTSLFGISSVSSQLRSPGATAALVSLTFLSVLWGVVRALFMIKIERIELPLTHLDPSLDGITIAQLSDIHIGPTIRTGFIRRIVALTNDLNPDIVVITGDLIDGKVNDLSPVASELSHLKAHEGRFYILGNHEFYWGARSWIEFMNNLGFRTLINESVVTAQRANGAALVISGVSDFAAEHFDHHLISDPARTFAAAPAHLPKILLCHQPHTARSNADLGYDVQLSGHTHGGQFIPWAWVIYFFQPFVSGLYQVNSMWLYVNRGTGTWGPPLRFGSSPEITLFTLKATHRTHD